MLDLLQNAEGHCLVGRQDEDAMPYPECGVDAMIAADARSARPGRDEMNGRLFPILLPGGGLSGFHGGAGQR